MRSTTTPRREVLQFASIMEDRLAANDHKTHWDGSSLDWLLERLKDEVEELEAVIAEGDLSMDVEISHEAADVANFAMMIADNVR